MDSLSQITLGAAVGEAILGRQLGNRAILWGAFFGTVPDLDIVLTPLVDSVGFIVHHRGLSHAFFSVALLAPLLGWSFALWYRRYPEAMGFWLWLKFFLGVFGTHILLDCCTTYGTQIFLPFSDARVAWNNVFVIDPLYTVPFLACVVVCLFLGKSSRWRRRVNSAGLLVSTGYLAITLANKVYVDRVFANELQRQRIEVRRFMTCPTPLNNVLWYGVAEVDNGYYLGFHSLLDSSRRIDFRFVCRRHELLGELTGSYVVDRLIWFADGYYCVRPHPEGALLHVMKFGALDLTGESERYPFTYLLRKNGSSEVRVERYAPQRSESLWRQIGRLWVRLKGV